MHTPVPSLCPSNVSGIYDIQRCGSGHHPGGLGAHASCAEGIVQDRDPAELLEHGFSRWVSVCAPQPHTYQSLSFLSSQKWVGPRGEHAHLFRHRNSQFLLPSQDERFQSERSSGTTMHGPPGPPPHALPSACLPHSLCTRILQGGGRFLPLLQKSSDLIHEIVSVNRSFPVRGLSSWVRRSQLIKVEWLFISRVKLILFLLDRTYSV